MTSSTASKRKPLTWRPTVSTAPTYSPIAELTTSVIGKLFELGVSTFNRNIDRNISNLQALATTPDLPTFVEQQQKFLQTLWSDQQEAFEAAAKTLRAGFEEAQSLLNPDATEPTKQDPRPKKPTLVSVKDKPSEIAAVPAVPASAPVKARPASANFEIYLDKAGEYRFRLQAADGAVLLRSEGYKSRASAINGVASVKKNANIDARYHEQVSASGKPTFNLKAGNHQVIGSSATFASTEQMLAAIDLIKRTATDAKVDDQTEAA